MGCIRPLYPYPEIRVWYWKSGYGTLKSGYGTLKSWYGTPISEYGYRGLMQPIHGGVLYRDVRIFVSKPVYDLDPYPCSHILFPNL